MGTAASVSLITGFRKRIASKNSRGSLDSHKPKKKEGRDSSRGEERGTDGAKGLARFY